MKEQRLEIYELLVKKVHEIMSSDEPNMAELKAYFSMMTDHESTMLAYRKQAHLEKKDEAPPRAATLAEVKGAIGIVFGKEYLN